MKTITFILCLLATSTLVAQKESIDNWIQAIVEDMVEMNDLDKYSSKQLSQVLHVDFIMVESVKNVAIKGNNISMMVNHGRGTFCTKLTFKYVEKSGNYYLVFSEPETKITLGKERQWVTPWIKKENVCD